MEIPLLELVSQIIDKGKFSKSKESEAKLKSHMENLFKLYKKDRNQSTSRMLYSAVADLARLGKGELAHKYAVKFEEEVGYEEID